MSLRLTNVNDIKETVLEHNCPSAYDEKHYKYGHSFKRLGLTLSAKGWTASIEYQGTIGFRGKGETQIEAILDAIHTAETEYNVTIN